MRLTKLIKATFVSSIALAILSGCGGGGGNPLSWLFGKEWQGVERVDTGNSNNAYLGFFSKNLAVNENGNIALAWSQKNSSNNPKIWISKYNGNNWSNPDSSIKPSNANFLSLALSMTNDNKIVVSWEELVGTHFIPKANVYDGGWLGVNNIYYNTNISAAGIDMATKNQKTIVVWAQKVGIHFRIIARIYNHTTHSWSPAHLISSSSHDSIYPKVTIDSNNRAIIAWKQKNSANKYDLYTAIYNINSWGIISFPHVRDNQIENVVSISISSDNNGNSMIIWDQYDNSLHRNIYATNFNGTSWSTPVVIEGSDKPAWQPTLKYNKANNEFVAIWAQQNSDNKYVIHLNRYSSGSWQGVEVLEDATDATESKYPKIAFDSDGNAVAVWLKKNSSNKFDVVAKSYDGSEWGDTEVIDNLDDSVEQAYIAFDGDDDAVAIWQQKDSSGKYHIFTNTLE